MKRLTSIKDVIDKIARQTGLGSKLKEVKILEQWYKEVGIEISNHTTPIKLFNGKLFVKVDSPVWMSQLTFIKKDIIDKINKAMNEKLIKDIFFTLK